MNCGRRKMKKPVSHGKRPDNRARPTPLPGFRAQSFQPNKEAALDLKEIRQIIELMKRNVLSLFHLEREGVKIKLRRGADFDGVPAATPGVPALPVMVAATVQGTPAAPPQ